MVLNVLLYCQQLVKNERVQTRPWEIILIDQYPPDLSLEGVECFINHPSGVKSRVKLDLQSAGSSPNLTYTKLGAHDAIMIP